MKSRKMLERRSGGRAASYPGLLLLVLHGRCRGGGGCASFSRSPVMGMMMMMMGMMGMMVLFAVIY